MSRILVIDDEPDVVQTLSHSLGRRGYVVETALTGEDGLVKARSGRFDVALLDINLPGIDGMQVLEQIKTVSCDTEVIMITGYGSIETAVDSLKKGAYDYIQKPIPIEKIALAIEKALERRQLAETVALYEISKAVFSTMEMDDLLKIVSDLAMKVLRADDATIMLFDEDKKLYVAFSHGLSERVKEETRLALGERIAGWVAMSRQSVILIDGLSDDTRFKEIKGREAIKSSMVIPLIKNNDVLGILAVNRMLIEENFSKIDLYKSNIIASLASLAIDNASLYRNLSSTVEELRRTLVELSTAQQQLSQSAKLAALGKLVADMAHEVNNPLMIISGTAQLSLMEEINNPMLENNLQTIFVESRRAKDIVQRLLKFSKPSKGVFTEVDINASLECIACLVENQFRLKNIIIRRNYGADLPRITVEDKQMQEVYMNLFNNACDAMENGGTITLTTSHDDGHIRIAFEDTGGGMSDEVKASILNPFFTTKEHGTGLGLPMCLSIVKTHSGEMDIQSQAGKGTTVIIRIPLKRQAEQ
ncbi:MAG: response regulator [Candidatus Omnitrophota bacterium]